MFPGFTSQANCLHSNLCLRLFFRGTQSRTPPSLLRVRTHGTAPMLERKHPNVISFPADSGPAVVTMNMCDLILDMKPKVSWWLHPTQQKSPHPVSRRGSMGQGIYIWGEREREGDTFSICLFLQAASLVILRRLREKIRRGEKISQSQSCEPRWTCKAPRSPMCENKRNLHL